jgi:hypothetical protein
MMTNTLVLRIGTRGSWANASVGLITREDNR